MPCDLRKTQMRIKQLLRELKPGRMGPSRRVTKKQKRRRAEGTDPPRKPRKLQVTRGWCTRVDEWLAANGHDRSWLAKQLGVPDATVMRVLNAEQHTSQYVEPISGVTGLPLPVQEVHNQWEFEVLEEIRDFAPGDRELVLAFIKRLKKDKAPSSPTSKG